MLSSCGVNAVKPRPYVLNKGYVYNSEKSYESPRFCNSDTINDIAAYSGKSGSNILVYNSPYRVSSDRYIKGRYKPNIAKQILKECINRPAGDRARVALIPIVDCALGKKNTVIQNKTVYHKRSCSDLGLNSKKEAFTMLDNVVAKINQNEKIRDKGFLISQVVPKFYDHSNRYYPYSGAKNFNKKVMELYIKNDINSKNHMYLFFNAVRKYGLNSVLNDYRQIMKRLNIPFSKLEDAIRKHIVKPKNKYDEPIFGIKLSKLSPAEFRYYETNLVTVTEEEKEKRRKDNFYFCHSNPFPVSSLQSYINKLKKLPCTDKMKVFYRRAKTFPATEAHPRGLGYLKSINKCTKDLKGDFSYFQKQRDKILYRANNIASCKPTDAIYHNAKSFREDMATAKSAYRHIQGLADDVNDVHQQLVNTYNRAKSNRRSAQRTQNFHNLIQGINSLANSSQWRNLSNKNYNFKTYTNTQITNNQGARYIDNRQKYTYIPQNKTTTTKTPPTSSAVKNNYQQQKHTSSTTSQYNRKKVKQASQKKTIYKKLPVSGKKSQWFAKRSLSEDLANTSVKNAADNACAGLGNAWFDRWAFKGYLSCQPRVKFGKKQWQCQVTQASAMCRKTVRQ